MLKFSLFFRTSLFLVSALSFFSFVQIEWTAQSCKAAACSIEFPNDKIEEKVDMHTNKTSYIYLSQLKKHHFSLSCTIYNRGAQSTFSNPEQHLIEAHLTKKQAEPIKIEDNIQLGKWKASAVHYKISSEKVEGILRVLVVDNMIYKLEVYAPQEKLENTLVDQFFESFKRVGSRP